MKCTSSRSNTIGKYTYLSEAHNNISWLHHLITINNGHDVGQNVSLDNSFTTSDHFPLVFTINIEEMIVDVEIDKGENRERFKIKWKDLSATDLNEYTSKSVVLLNSLFLNHDLILCDDIKCTNVVHHKAIVMLCTLP